MERLYGLSVCTGTVVGTVILTRDVWKEDADVDMLTLALAPVVGAIIGVTGGLIPPLGAYWLACYYRDTIRGREKD